MDGDGTSDYFWMDHNGKGWGYLNIGKGENKWYDLGLTATGTGYDRTHIRMGVLTKTGRADYIVVDEDTGQALWWQNLGSDGGWNWASKGEFATGPSKTIENTYGWKFSGKNVRFAEYVHSIYQIFLGRLVPLTTNNLIQLKRRWLR